GFDAHEAAFPDRPGRVELVTSPDPDSPDAVLDLLGEEAARRVARNQQDDDDSAYGGDDGDADDDQAGAGLAPTDTGPAAIHQTFVCRRVEQLAASAPGATIGVLVPTNKLV